MSEKIKEKKPMDVKTQKRIYLLITSIFVIAAIVFAILFIVFYRNNISLKQKEAQVVEQYNEIAREHENLVDQDYATVYFNGNNVYIPSENIIIRYQG